jgi:hypothetical protein
MRIRQTPLLTVLTLLALIAAACGGGSTTDSTLDTTTTTAPAPEAVLLSYSLEPGTSYSYEIDLDQDIDLTAEGDPNALGEEQIPAEMSLTVNGTTTLTHTIAAGPEPGTYEINITGDLSDLEFDGTIDGEPLTAEDIPDFAGMEPIDVTVVVDEQGNIIPQDTGMGEDLLGGLGGLGGLDMLGQLGSSAGVGQFIGPPFSQEEVTVGDTWSETAEIPTLPGNDPITTKVDSEVVGADTIEGNEVFVIETTTTTSAIEFDLAELLIGFMNAFVPEDATDEELAEFEALREQLRFAFAVDPTVSDMTTWFDYQAGLARQADFANTTHMVMDINVPDEATGELAAFGMDMTISQNIRYRLVEPGNA